MDTPELPHSIFGKDFENVYEPAEDTFLLLDSLEQDLDKIRKHTSICLEIGSGSGTVITAISKALSQGPCRLFIATDINPRACETTKKCSSYHRQAIQVIRTNLAESIVDRLEGMVDLIVFNPPYVPTESEEVDKGTTNQIYRSWAGGCDGRVMIDIFLNSYVPRLLSKPHGVAYMVALDENKPEDLLDLLLETYNIQGTVVQKRRAGSELLSIIKYSHHSNE